MLRVLILSLSLFFIQGVFSSEEGREVKKIIAMDVHSAITPATLNFIGSALTRAKNEKDSLLLIRMNTPGGLVSTTKSILTLFGESDIPIVVWITPSGASATSAGAIIASGAHLLFMSEGTNIGAATPVDLGKDIPSKDLKDKAVNDLVALVQSLSEVHGRNQKLFGEMVEKASSFKPKDALEKKLINGIANTEKELIENLNGKSIVIKGKTFPLKVNNPQVEHLKMDWGQALLNLLADPNLAYVFFMIGAALLYFELQAPHGFISGSIGIICLLISGIGFQVLPFNWGAFGLIAFAFILFFLEIYITSYGILTFVALASLLTGSLFLFRTENAYMELSSSVVFSAVAAIAVFVIGLALFWAYDAKKNKRPHFFSLKGKEATVSAILETHKDGLFLYQIKIDGEVWQAQSKTKFNVGDNCKISEHDHKQMTLVIE